MTYKKPCFRILLIFSAILLAFSACASSPSSLPTAQDYPSVMSSGTGFFISSDGIVVTCAHVIEDASFIGVWVGGIRYSAEILSIDYDTDLAILKVNHRPTRYFRLANFDSAGLGQRVYALGFPLTNILGSEIRLTDGIISAFSGYASDPTNFQVSAPVHPGNSGGPIFNERFEVLGVAASRLVSGVATNVTFAVKNSYIHSLIPPGTRITGGNVRNMQDAVNATVQISIDDIYEGPPVIIVNNTGFTIRSVYISQITSDVWGQDRLMSNETLPNGRSLSFNLPFPLTVINRYDIQLVDANGNAYVMWDVPLSANQRIIFTQEHSRRGGEVLYGTYYFDPSLYLTFSGNNYTLTSSIGTETGTYSIRGNSIIFSRSMWGSNTWTIVDSHTLLDPENDRWIREEAELGETLTGSYYFSNGLYLTFEGNNFTRVMPDGSDHGTYIISGNTIVFSRIMWGSNTWAILDPETLRDPDGDLWVRR